MISAVDLLKGIGKLAEMDVIEVEGAPGYLDTNFEGKLEASKAKVYAQDKDGKVKEMGSVESTTTSMPLMAFEHAVYFGSHSTMSKATINTKESKMEVETAKTNNDETDVANKAYNVLFEEYGRGTIIEFTEVQK